MEIALYVTSCFSLAALKILLLSLIFNILIIMCIWVSISLPKFEKFFTIISLNNFSAPFSLLELSWWNVCVMVCHNSLRLSSVFYFLFVSLANFKSLSFLILSSASLGCWNSLLGFQFCHCILRLLDIYLVLFCCFYFFVKCNLLWIILLTLFICLSAFSCILFVLIK